MAIVKPTALGPVANTDTKLLIYGLFQKGRVFAQDGVADGGVWSHPVSAISSLPFGGDPGPGAVRGCFRRAL